MMVPSTMTEMWTTMGSTIASFMFVWAIIRQYCPYEVRRYFEKYTHRIMGFFYPYIKISVHEFTGDRLKRSEAYVAVEAYLSANSAKSAKRLKAEMGKESTNLVLSMDEYEGVTDEFKGVKSLVGCKQNCVSYKAHVILSRAGEEILQDYISQAAQGDDNRGLFGACGERRERDQSEKQAEEALH